MRNANRNGTAQVDLAGDGRVGLSGPLTFDSVPGVFHRLERQQTGAAALQLVDLAGVTSADSAGLALLLEWQARARAAGGKLSVRNAPNGLLRLARLCEAVELLDLAGRGDEGAGEP